MDDRHGNGVWAGIERCIISGTCMSGQSRCIIADNLTTRASPLLSVANFSRINQRVCKCGTFPCRAVRFCPKRQDMQRAVLLNDLTVRTLLIIFNLTQIQIKDLSGLRSLISS